jgi:hypothetical protein
MSTIEVPKPTKTLTIAFPAKFQIHARFAMTLIEVVDKLRESQTEWKVKVKYILGKSNLSHARSVMTTEWYEEAKDEDGFFFIDADHTFTAEDILRVIGLEGDLNCGIYSNRNRDPVCYPLDGGFSDAAENIPLRFAATGFLFFRKSALVKIHTWMKEKEGLDRVVISDFPGSIEQRTIPFFHSIMEPPRADGKRFWLGEDFSFSWRAIEAGLKIRGCFTYTLGHEIPYVVFPDKPRRGPRTWHPAVFTLYCGNQTIQEETVKSICSIPLQQGRPIIVYCSNSKPFEDSRLQWKRYEEFQAHDTFGTFFIYGTEPYQQIAPIPPPKELIVYIDKQVDQLPSLLLQAVQVFVPTIDLYRHLSPVFSKPGQLNLCGESLLGTFLKPMTPPQ